MTGDFQARDLIDVMDEAVRYNEFLVEQLIGHLGDANSILDFGAGNGRFSAAMKQAGYEVHAVEPDRELRRRLGEIGIPSAPSLDENATTCFEGAYSLNVLEHIDDDGAILKALFDRLQPGGKLLIYVPAFQILFSSNDERVGHFRRYSKGGLSRVIEAAGFEIISARYVDSIGFIAGLLYRFLGNRDGDLDVRAVRFYDGFVFPISRQLDKVFDGFVGKNLLVRAVRPGISAS